MANIDNNISDIQKRILGVLQKIHDCCLENDIKYSLHGGTLLGAIREKGFISWDDDADISMTREDYKKFMQIIQKDNVYGLKSTHFNQVTQIVSKDYPDVWVDIFVYDYISANRMAQKIKFALLVFLNICVKPRGMLHIRKAVNDYPVVVKVVYDLIYLISGLFPMKWRRSLRENVASSFLCGDKTLIFKSNDQIKGLKEMFSKNIMREYMLTEFEKTQLLVSMDYEKMLITSYGKDYMIPVRYGEKDSDVHMKMRRKMREN